MPGTGLLKYLAVMLQVSEAASSTPVSRRQPLKTAQWDILESSVSLMYEAGRPKPVLCDNLEGLGEEGIGRGVQDGRDTCIPMADSYVLQKPSQYCNYPPIKIN